jgi:hypothetical protein
VAIRITAVVLLIFAAGFLLEASRYPFGTPNAPGAGFLPMTVGVGFAIAALYMLVFPGSRPERVFPADRAGTVRIVTTIVVLALTIALLKWLGFLVVATLMMLALLLVLDRRPIRDVILAPSAAVMVYVIFKVWLRVPLPTGMLSF